MTKYNKQWAEQQVDNFFSQFLGDDYTPFQNQDRFHHLSSDELRELAEYCISLRIGLRSSEKSQDDLRTKLGHELQNLHYLNDMQLKQCIKNHEKLYKIERSQIKI